MPIAFTQIRPDGALGLEEIADLTPHKEEVADFGDLDTWVQDLGRHVRRTATGREGGTG